MNTNNEIKLGEQARDILKKRQEELEMVRQAQKNETKAEVFERFKRYLVNDFGVEYIAVNERFYHLVALRGVGNKISMSVWWLFDSEAIKHRFEHIEFAKYADRWVDAVSGEWVMKEMEYIFDKDEAQDVTAKLSEFISKPELMNFPL